MRERGIHQDHGGLEFPGQDVPDVLRVVGGDGIRSQLLQQGRTLRIQLVGMHRRHGVHRVNDDVSGARRWL
jgi:hypothetical protein